MELFPLASIHPAAIGVAALVVDVMLMALQVYLWSLVP